jgi:uncharacterized membrane protein
MVTKNTDLIKSSINSVKGNLGFAIAVFIVYIVVIGLIQTIPMIFGMIFEVSKGSFDFMNSNMVIYRIIGFLLTLLVLGPMQFGINSFFLSLSRNQSARLEQIFGGFRFYKTTTFAYLQITLFTLLWSLLLIVPGIIASISYSMTFFIMVDHPAISGREAIEQSKKMMNGNKMKFFILNLMFFGTAFIALIVITGLSYLLMKDGLVIIGLVLTLLMFISIVLLTPYFHTTIAKFYDDIKDIQIAKEENQFS